MRRILGLVTGGNNLPTYLRSRNHIGATMNTTETESIRHQAKIAALPLVENRAGAATSRPASIFDIDQCRMRWLE